MRTRKIHIFTIIQLLALAFILGIKLSSLAPSFPFFIICLIPLRKLLTKFYTEHEMEEVCWLWYVEQSILIGHKGMLIKFLTLIYKTNLCDHHLIGWRGIPIGNPLSWIFSMNSRQTESIMYMLLILLCFLSRPHGLLSFNFNCAL